MMKRSGWVWAVVVMVLAGAAWAEAPATTRSSGGTMVDPPKGLRVVTCGHSFHYFVGALLGEMAKGAGIQGHEVACVSFIGGSRVIQHWNVPDEKNKAKKILEEGKADVLTLSPMHVADDGIDKFAELAVKGNPAIRITIEEFWMPYDKNEWPFKGDQKLVDPNAATGESLRALHEPYFAAMDAYVAGVNKKLGKPVLYVVPVGQAMMKLREKVIAGEVPGIAKQSELFVDKLGHGTGVVQALVAYCHFGVIYQRSPVGLPLPGVMKGKEGALNKLLQEIAWQAVQEHPMSGVTKEMR